MRTLLFKMAVCATLLFASTTGNAQGNEFKKLSKIEGVEHVNISKSMLKLAVQNGGNIDLGKGNSIRDSSGDILKKIDGIEVFTAEDKKTTEQLSKAVRNILNDKGWEPLIDVNDEDGEKVKIYQFKKGEHTTVAIFSEEKDETELVVISGKLDFAKLMEQANKLTQN